ncbi:MAG: hypothetical protein KDD58_04965 [Bdellovibrionales bacterium]|nr:hypothetical protein [Bdellovibrionales bacterium]
MKSLNQKEIEELVARLKSLIGATLNGVFCKYPMVTLEFYSKGVQFYVLIDLSPAKPVCIISNEHPPIKLVKNHKPITLFLKAHFIGKKMSDVEYSSEKGRVFVIKFNEGQESLEVRLFPHGQNLIANTENKTVAWHKPKDIIPQKTDVVESYEVRSPEEILVQWKKAKEPKKHTDDPLKDFRKKQKKILTAIQKLEQENKKQIQLQDQWKLLASELSKNLEKPLLSFEFYNPQKLPVENMAIAYEKVKIMTKKIKGQKERLQELKLELNELTPQDIAKKIEKSPPVRHLKVNKLKKWVLSSGVTVAIGRNAKENTDLLRQAKAWDLWLHLKDYPGAYGFVYRARNQNISDIELRKVAMWVAKMSLKSKWDKMKGEKINVLVAECRYVQPIKGDKLGRVTYKKAKYLVIVAE